MKCKIKCKKESFDETVWKVSQTFMVKKAGERILGDNERAEGERKTCYQPPL
jgi:hypothetical protein